MEREGLRGQSSVILETIFTLTLSWRMALHLETNSLICSSNQWTCFYMIGTSVMKELNRSCREIMWKRFHFLVNVHVVSL